MRLECRRDLRDEIVELLILDRRQERLRHGVDDRLVVRDFVPQKRAIEFRAFGGAQGLHRRLMVLCHREVVRRRRMHAELFREVAPLLANHRVIVDEHGAKLTNVLRRALFLGEGARLDIPRVGGVEDGDDRRIIERRGARQTSVGSTRGGGAEEEGGGGGNGGDAMARAVGVRREGNVGKPATLYGIPPEADTIFSKAYEPVLTTLLVTLTGRLGDRELGELLRDVGRQLAASAASNGASLEQRVRAAAAALEGLGGDTVVERQGNGSYVLRGFACPLRRSGAACPPLCSAVEELVAGITHAKVQERCDRSERPRCSFLVTPRGTRSKS